MKRSRSVAIGLASWFATSAALATVCRASEPARKPHDPMQLQDLEALGPILRKHVAHVIVDVQADPMDVTAAPTRDGYGIVLGPSRVAALSAIVDRAGRVRIEGPVGSPILGRAVVVDPERRVAIIDVAEPLATVGLVPAGWTARAERKVGDPVFALAATDGVPTVITGWITHTGEDPEDDDGHVRVNLRLFDGMPAFDDRARFVGFARTTTWDLDKGLLVPPEMIAAAATSTVSPPAPGPAPNERPWWARDLDGRRR